jgi:hypothetical protein
MYKEEVRVRGTNGVYSFGLDGKVMFEPNRGWCGMCFGSSKEDTGIVYVPREHCLQYDRNDATVRSFIDEVGQLFQLEFDGKMLCTYNDYTYMWIKDPDVEGTRRIIVLRDPGLCGSYPPQILPLSVHAGQPGIPNSLVLDETVPQIHIDRICKAYKIDSAHITPSDEDE